jgi:carboxyl-terminal processing protease
LQTIFGKKRMKKSLLSLLLACAFTAQAATPATTPAATLSPAAPPQLSPQQQQGQAANLAAQILTRYHYKATPLDDALSEKIFDRYLKALDPEKMFFVQADIDQFSFARNRLDDAIYRENLQVPFDIFNLYEQRVVDRLSYARELLKQGFDFSQNETWQYQREKAAWPKTEDEVKDLWRKRVKNDWLRLKLTGKDDKAIRETLDKRYNTSLSRAYKYNAEDVFQVFMNAYTNAVEPHTDYFGPKSTEDFDIAMRLSLVGIGAVLQEKDDYTTVRELVAGGPAAVSGKLKVGDRIVGVGQGKNSAPTDVVGWRIDDVVKLIRGTKDSVVRLDVLPAEAGPDAKHKFIELVRDKISLEKQAAKKSIQQVKDKDGVTVHKVGVISLPSFYQDFEGRRKGDKDFRSASHDVARLLDELKKEKAEAVLIDLRNNGGGALDEAVEMTSLFIGKGPVVMEKTSQGSIKVEASNNVKRAWDGPLGVLINRGSASASEIFAAAIQDYGRGVIIGEPSFGKGTVQTLVNLDQMAHNDKAKFGELKMTIAQFFRVNGGTTQLRGVTPDIAFPTISDPESFGESSYENALPWTQIKAADYAPITADLGSLLPQLKERHTSRVAKDKEFQYLLEDIAEFNTIRKKHVISLNETERRKEHDQQEAKMKLRDGDKGDKGKKTAKDDTAAAKKAASKDAALKDADAEDGDFGDEPASGTASAKKESKDVLLSEAARILGDEVDLLKINTRLVARTTPAPAANAKRE